MKGHGDSWLVYWLAGCCICLFTGELEISGLEGE